MCGSDQIIIRKQSLQIVHADNKEDSERELREQQINITLRHSKCFKAVIKQGKKR